MVQSILTRVFLAVLGLSLAGAASAQVVISQVYGGGGNTSATYTHDYVELFNRGSVAVSIGGWSVQYASATGTAWTATPALPAFSLQPGQYFLIQLATGGAVGNALPTPDHSGSSNMSATNGKVALATNTTAFSGTCPTGASLVDLVGFGTANCFEGSSAAPPGTNQNAIYRSAGGCTDTDVNSADFTAALAIARNSATTLSPCAASLPLVTFDPAPVSAAEGGSGASNPLQFTVNVSPAPQTGSPVGFDIAVSGDAGRFSYTGPASLVVTDSTTLPVTITVNTIGNELADGDSQVTVSLSGFTGTAAGQVSPLARQGTIVDDDDVPPTISIANVSQLEGNSGTSMMAFTVLLGTPASAGGVSFAFATADGTASAGSDYVAANGSGSIVEGASSTTINVEIIGDTVGEADETFTLALTNVVGAQPNAVQATGTILNDDRYHVWQVQGSGRCSPFIVPCSLSTNTTSVTVPVSAAIVTAVGATAFTMQSADADSDNDPATSDGVYVFTFAAPVTDGGQLLAIGDRVVVTGGVKEFFGLTQIEVGSTRNASNSIVRVATGQPLPTPVVFGAAMGPNGTPSSDPNALSCPGSGLGGAAGDDTNFECFASMLVTIPQGVVSAPNQRFSTDLFAEAYISPHGERGVREKGALFGVTLGASNAAAGVWDGNPEIIEMDADFLMPANAGLELVGGARFSATGVIGFDFGDYEFWPTSLDIAAGSDTLPRPVPTAGPDELTVASFNAFRLCDAIDDRPTPGIDFICAATNTLEVDANRVLHERGQVSAYIREVLRSPDVVAMQEVEKLSVLQALATQIAADGGPVYQAFLIEGNDPGGIDVAYLVNSARIENVVVEQVNADETWNDPSTGVTVLHDRPPLLLHGDFIGSGETFRFQVINHHGRSRGGVETGDASSQRVRAKRFLQARSIAQKVQALQTGAETADIPLLVIGDFNAYQFTDAFADVVGLIAGTYRNDENTCAPTNGVTDCELPGDVNIVDPPLVNAVLLLDKDEQYSYRFTENFGAIQGSAGRDLAVNQVLDHVLFNAVAQPFVSGMAYGRANVDASVQRFRVCNYRFRDLAACPQGPDAVPPAPWQPIGSSDHDGLVLFLSPPRPAPIFRDGFEG
jgi:uncharacterized protein